MLNVFKGVVLIVFDIQILFFDLQCNVKQTQDLPMHFFYKYINLEEESQTPWTKFICFKHYIIYISLYHLQL